MGQFAVILREEFLGLRGQAVDVEGAAHVAAHPPGDDNILGNQVRHLFAHGGRGDAQREFEVFDAGAAPTLQNAEDGAAGTAVLQREIECHNFKILSLCVGSRAATYLLVRSSRRLSQHSLYHSATAGDDFSQVGGKGTIGVGGWEIQLGAWHRAVPFI